MGFLHHPHQLRDRRRHQPTSAAAPRCVDLLSCAGEVEQKVTEGSKATLVLYLDGALLIDPWNEINIPEPMRRHWAAVVGATLDSPIIADSESTAATRTLGGHRWMS